MRRALLITNPAAARTHPKTVREVRDVLRRGGWQTEVVATGGPGDARRLAAEGVEARMDAVAVFGGDGTTMQAASALVGTGVILGLIPGGTGNLLAGNLRIPFQPGAGGGDPGARPGQGNGPGPSRRFGGEPLLRRSLRGRV